MQNFYDKLTNDDNFEHNCDSDDSMPSTERELADNAQWKIIQKNTFTRWVNVHLKNAKTSINDLQTDFEDGLKLIALIEVLSGHKFSRFNKRTSFRTQKLENVTMVLKFLEEKEGLKLVNIDSTDIVDCRLKLILGLIWTLILHYSISKPVWEGEDSNQDTKQTPKQRMMTWINAKLPNMTCRNLTTDWNDGTKMGALVDSCAPGLCPDWCDWKPENALINTKEAMDIAEQWLDVPQLIKPEEMIDPNVDEKAMMTYLSQFPNAKVKPGAPMRQKLNPNKVKIYGPGIDSNHLRVNEEAEFTVDAYSAGKGELKIVMVRESDGEQINVHQDEIEDKPNCFKCSYVPELRDTYRIQVYYGGVEVPKSPVIISVHKTTQDISKVKVYGAGIEKNGVVFNTETSFIVDTKESGTGDIDCVILDNNHKKDTVIPTIIPESDGKYTIKYTPKSLGVHSINVYFGGQQVPKSPYGVQVSPRSNARLVQVTGRGVQQNGIRVAEEAEFYIDVSKAGDGALNIKLLDSTKKEVPISVNNLESDIYKCVYVPVKQGQYTLNIEYDDVPVNRSPYKINVLPSKQSSVKAYGPGLVKSVVDKPAIFVVDINDEAGNLGFSIEGPSQAKIECCDNQDTSVTVCYWPSVVGEYAVHVLCDGEDIPNSPFMAEIIPRDDKVDVSKITVTGQGVLSNKVYMDKINEFTIDCTQYPEYKTIPPIVNLYQGDGTEVPVTMTLSGRKYTCKYQPLAIGNHKIFVTCDDQPVDKSPYRLNVPKPAQPENVRIIGDGIKKATRFQPTEFSIDTTNAGDAKLTVDIIDELGNSIPFTIDNKTDPDIYDVQFKPETAGPQYQAIVLFNGEQISGSPFNIEILPDKDISGVHVEKLEKKIFQESFVRFCVNATSIDKTGKGVVKAIFTDPNGYKSACMVKNLGNGNYNCNYSPYNAGWYQLDVTYDDLPLHDCPYKVEVVPGCDPNKISVYGDGLNGGITNQPSQFTIDLDGAGQGNLGLTIEGPSDAKINCNDNLDGTCTVEYSATIPGMYDIYIRFNDEDIKASPFQVPIKDPINSANIKLFGPVLNPEAINRVGKPITFMVDAARAGEAPLEVNLTNNNGKSLPIKVEQRENAMPGIYDVTIKPEVAGDYKLNIKFNDELIHNTNYPQYLKILPKYEVDKVKFAAIDSDPIQFKIDKTNAGDGDIEIELIDPHGNIVKPEIHEKNGKYDCFYDPDELGSYQLKVLFNGELVPGSNMKFAVKKRGEANKCFIENDVPEYIQVNNEAVLTVNIADSGNDGLLKCRIYNTEQNNQLLPCEIEDNNNGTQSIYYTPTNIGDYSIEISYGHVIIPGGKIKQKAVENMPEEEIIQMEQSKGQSSTQQFNGFNDSKYGFYPVTFKFPYNGNQIEAIVITPSGIREEIQVETTIDKFVTIFYDPKERGMHEMIVNCDDKPIHGSPFKFFAENIGSGKIAAYGPGLSHGITGTAAEFTIVSKNSHGGGLSLAIEGPSKAEILCRDNEDGTCDVTYYPLMPGEYNIVIKFANQNIAGSPFVATISGPPQSKSQICIGSTTDVPLKIENVDAATLTAYVKSPSGIEEPCILKTLPNEALGITFTPKEVGDHYINIFQAGSHIPESPYKLIVRPSEIANSSKVRVYGDGLKHGKTIEQNFFTVDTKEAGFGGLSLSIEGPSKAEIECYDHQDGTCQVSYIPSEPGTYMINIKYANEHVLGSPFAVKIDGEASAKLMEKIIRQQEAADITQVGSQCELTLKIPGTNPLDMRATVTNQSGNTEVCEIVDLEEGQYSIKFIPHEMGIHTVNVQHRGVHIPGSPFQFTVGPIVDGGAHKVVASGPGLRSGRVGQANEFGIYTREAGAGGLSIAIEGPSKAEIDFEDRKDGSCTVRYHVKQPGEYICSVKFNDDNIRNSPFRINVTDSLTDYISMATVGQAHVKEWLMGKPAVFTINYGATGSGSSISSGLVVPKLRAIVISPSGKEENAIVQNIDKNQYAIRFIPKESGEHYINVTEESNNKHIPGSPYRISVGHHHSDPSMVQAYGEGLSEGLVGKKNMFVVNTNHAGTGELNVTVDGPSKVQLYFHDHEDGYEFIYIPYEAGEYRITIKYGGNYNIAGSPFIANITGSSPEGIIKEHASQKQAHLQVNTAGRTSSTPIMAVPKNASKPLNVQCFGNGMKKAHLNQVNSFTVDASQAGSGILFAGIAGPHSQSEELSVKHVGSNNFIVNYRVQERGRHYLIVKWGDQNIPGSPFVVDVI